MLGFGCVCVCVYAFLVKLFLCEKSWTAAALGHHTASCTAPLLSHPLPAHFHAVVAACGGSSAARFHFVSAFCCCCCCCCCCCLSLEISPQLRGSCLQAVLSDALAARMSLCMNTRRTSLLFPVYARETKMQKKKKWWKKKKKKKAVPAVLWTGVASFPLVEARMRQSNPQSVKSGATPRLHTQAHSQG